MSGKIVLITGATSGYGLSTAKLFKEKGDTVIIASRNAEKVRKTVEENGFADGFTLDVTDFAAWLECKKHVLEKYGRIDVLVNNAGITADKLLLRMAEADFDNVLATNLKGAFFCTKAACRFMMHQRYGRIISVSSVVGLHGNAGQANYAASKAGLIGLTKSAAKEYAARNITANVVAPGFIATDMTAVLSEPARAAAEAAIPAGKIGHAEDVAAAVAFLAGEQAGYITGQVLCVDGGMGM